MLNVAASSCHRDTDTKALAPACIASPTCSWKASIRGQAGSQSEGVRRKGVGLHRKVGRLERVKHLQNRQGCRASARPACPNVMPSQPQGRSTTAGCPGCVHTGWQQHAWICASVLQARTRRVLSPMPQVAVEIQSMAGPTLFLCQKAARCASYMQPFYTGCQYVLPLTVPAGSGPHLIPNDFEEGSHALVGVLPQAAQALRQVVQCHVLLRHRDDTFLPQCKRLCDNSRASDSVSIPGHTYQGERMLQTCIGIPLCKSVCSSTMTDSSSMPSEWRRAGPRMCTIQVFRQHTACHVACDDPADGTEKTHLAAPAGPAPPPAAPA